MKVDDDPSTLSKRLQQLKTIHIEVQHQFEIAVMNVEYDIFVSVFKHKLLFLRKTF